MAEITRRATFYAGNRGPTTFHLETDGAIVNITVGLRNREGHVVTALSIIPDDESRGGDGCGRTWRRVGDRIVCQVREPSSWPTA